MKNTITLGICLALLSGPCSAGKKKQNLPQELPSVAELNELAKPRITITPDKPVQKNFSKTHHIEQFKTLANQKVTVDSLESMSNLIEELRLHHATKEADMLQKKLTILTEKYYKNPIFIVGENE